MGTKIEKTRLDYLVLKNAPDGQPSDWLRQPWNTHHWTDMFVESCRRAPYLMGHWWAVYFPVSIGLLVWRW